jgi:hypothetical protein
MLLHNGYIWVGGNGDMFLYDITTKALRGNWRVHNSSLNSMVTIDNRVWTGTADGIIGIWEDKVRNTSTSKV